MAFDANTTASITEAVSSVSVFHLEVVYGITRFSLGHNPVEVPGDCWKAGEKGG